MPIDIVAPEERYLDLLKKSLINLLYLENEVRLIYILLSVVAGQPIDIKTIREMEKDDHPILKVLRDRRGEGQIQFIWNYPDGKSGETKSINLRDATEVAHTMIGGKRLDNIHRCLDVIMRDRVPGDVMETGVWRGGAVVFMRGYLAAYNMTDRTVWAADSFAGLPKPATPEDAGYDFSVDVHPILAISLEEVQQLFAKYGLLDEQVQFVKGWFHESLPNVPVKELALLRLDGDLYKSTRDALVNLYHKVVPGGFIIIDDYGDFQPCQKAVDEFRLQNNIREPIERIDWTGVFWRKGDNCSIYPKL
ncbi:MAG: TylF/MycF family methyltransferase [Proteobacteria bacterium]|nr:TylF/MycF family methyltransferase [Pseudomonadota bacterium]